MLETELDSQKLLSVAPTVEKLLIKHTNRDSAIVKASWEVIQLTHKKYQSIQSEAMEYNDNICLSPQKK